MITAGAVINIIEAMSPSELAKVKEYLLADTKPVKPKRSKVQLRPEHSRENLRAWLLKQNGTKIIYKTKSARKQK